VTPAGRSAPSTDQLGWCSSLPPEALFLLSAIAQYAGASIAVRTFDEVPATTVALFRVAGASVTLILLTRAWQRPWSRRDIVSVAQFGTLTAAMNLFFYLAVERLPLGKSVTIEFIGPIAVAGWRTRSRRNAIALAFAATGVAVLSGGSVGSDRVGLLLIFGASACWAGYIVLGYRSARAEHGVAGLGVGLAFGTIALVPFGAAGLGAATATASRFARCLLVGVLSNTIGYGIDQIVMRRFSTRRFAVMLALLPVVAVFAGAVALDQQPSRLDLVGVLAVVVGVAVQDRT
jgi:inner membrane transporter RhtA